MEYYYWVLVILWGILMHDHSPSLKQTCKLATDIISILLRGN